VNRAPNTEAVIRLAAEKSEQARKRTREAIRRLQQQGKPINFSTVCEEANVSKTFLYDPRHADLAEEIRRLRELPVPRPQMTCAYFPDTNFNSIVLTFHSFLPIKYEDEPKEEQITCNSHSRRLGSPSRFP